MNLGNLKKATGSTHRTKRIGRGKGSGHGNQSTRGGKGQTARSGKPHPYLGFEGGQMRLVRIMPKRGFISPHRVEYTPVNLAEFDIFDANTVVTPEVMKEKGLIKSLGKLVKVLARGEISKSLTIRAHRFSESAQAKIEKAGGKVEVI
ncbi:MAG: 50S ribosomal protein L15 [Candidatus Riflebacteria bacterium]|nr:50S ribosomal protein L15 [Candidatus Riflebacteria bacterium]